MSVTTSADPVVSVVMGVFNAEDHLRETIDSILAQTEPSFELVVVDDGSKDSTSTILEGYRTRDPRVRIITQVNAGLTVALIAGCAQARGRYIARQDAGDLSHPSRLAMQRALLDETADLAFVSCATQFAGPELEPLWITRPLGAAVEPRLVVDPSGTAYPLLDGPTHHGAVMFRRDFYIRAGGYRAAFYYGQDHDLWYRLAELGRFQGTADVLYTARILPGSLTGTAHELQVRLGELSIASFRARQQGLPETPILAAAAAVRPQRARRRRSVHAAGLYFIGEALRRNGDRRARHYLWSSVRHWPFSLQAWARLVQTLKL